MPSPTPSDRLGSVAQNAPAGTRVFLAVVETDDDVTSASWSCSECTGTGTGSTPGSVKHDASCVYVGGNGCW